MRSRFSLSRVVVTALAAAVPALTLCALVELDLRKHEPLRRVLVAVFRGLVLVVTLTFVVLVVVLVLVLVVVIGLRLFSGLGRLEGRRDRRLESDGDSLHVADRRLEDAVELGGESRRLWRKLGRLVLVVVAVLLRLGRLLLADGGREECLHL